MFTNKEMLKNLQNIVNHHFFPIYLKNVNILKGGLFNESYLLTLSNNSKMVIRISPDLNILLPYEHLLMYAEKWAYDLCNNNNIPVPNIIVIDDSLKFINKIYMITKYIQGVSLNEIKLPMYNKIECYDKAGQAIRKMHGIKGLHFGRLAQQLINGGFDTWSEAILYEVESLKNLIAPTNLLTPKNWITIDKVFQKNIPLLNEIKIPYLTHGDLWSGNILALMENGTCKFKAIIDADHSMFGDPEFDFLDDSMINESFKKGYGKSLTPNKNSVIRRRLYLLLFSIRQCYIFEYLHNWSIESKQQRAYINKLLYELN